MSLTMCFFNPPSKRRSLFERCPWRVAALLAAAYLCPSLSSAENPSSPRFSPEQASRILTLRNVGLAQLEEERPKEARATFAKLTDLVPGDVIIINGGDRVPANGRRR